MFVKFRLIDKTILTEKFDTSEIKFDNGNIGYWINEKLIYNTKHISLIYDNDGELMMKKLEEALSSNLNFVDLTKIDITQKENKNEIQG